MTKFKTSILALSALLIFFVPACKKETEQIKQEEKTAAEAPTAEIEAAKDADGAAPAVDPQTADDAKAQTCPANPNDPDGLYRDFFDCKTPFPLRDGKAAKYDKSWKQGDDGALMNGYEFHEISQEFIDDYKKALEAAGYANDRPKEAPPMYQKKLSDTSELRVELKDTLCKEGMDDCGDSKKTGNLTIQTAIMTFDAPEEPATANPAQDAEKIKAAYNHPADPDKHYAGLPNYCIFPIKDEKALQYVSKNDLLDDPAAREPDQITYTFVSTETLDIEKFIGNTFVKQLEDAGFERSDGDGSFTKKTGNDTCTIEWDSGEGELNLRFYIRHIEDSSL